MKKARFVLVLLILLAERDARLMSAPLARWPALEGRVPSLGPEHVQAFPGPLQAIIAHISYTPVGIDAQPVAHVAAQQSVDGHSIMLARDIPQGLVDPREGRHEHVPAAEERRTVNVLPVVLDAEGPCR